MASKKLRLWEVALFAVLGALMFASKQALEFLPNVHMLGMFIVLYTRLFRVKALIPIYVFIFLEGVYAGFSTWWIPYLYIWAVLWGMAMLIPEKIKPSLLTVCFMGVCSIHGFIYGTLYAPFQAVAFGLTFKGMLTWIVAGLPYDVIHGVSNFFMGALVMPLYLPLKKVLANYYNLS